MATSDASLPQPLRALLTERPRAFLSYRRLDASAFAHWLRQVLLAFTLPRTVSERTERPSIYIDDSYSRGTEDFWRDNIVPPLEQADTLIVVASRGALQPHDDRRPNWVTREVDHYCSLTGPRMAMVALLHGDFGDPLPGELHRRFPNIYRADFRRFRPWLPLRLQPRSVQDAVLDLVATLHRIPSERMPELRMEQEKRSRRLAVTAAASTIIVLTALALTTGFALWSRSKESLARQRAEIQQHLAEQQTVRAQTEKTIAEEERAAMSAERSRIDDQRASAFSGKTGNLVNEGENVTGALLALDSVAFHTSGQTVRMPPERASAVLRALRSNHEVSLLPGPTKAASGLRFTPDGKVLVATFVDGTVRSWTSDGTLIKTGRGNERNITDLSLSADGKTLATVSTDSAVRFWTVPDLVFRQVVPGGDHDDGAFHTIDLAPDGGLTITTTSEKPSVVVWDNHRRAVARTLAVRANGIQLARFSPDGQQIAAVTREPNQLVIWRSSSDTVLKTVDLEGGTALGLSWSHDGRLVAIPANDGEVRIYDVQSAQITATARGHLGPVLSVAFSPNDLLLATGSSDKTIRLWRVKSGASVAVLRGHLDEVAAITFHPDGEHLASSSSDGTVRIWSAADFMRPRIFGATGTSAASSFDADWPNHRVVVGHEDGSVVLVDLKSQETQTLPPLVHGRVRITRFVDKGQKLVIAGDGGESALWKFADQVGRTLEQNPDDYWRDVVAAEESSRFVSLSHQGMGKVWSIDKATILASFGEPEIQVFDAHMDGTGITFLSCDSEDNFCGLERRKDGTTQEVEATDEDPPAGPSRLSISPPDANNTEERYLNFTAFSPNGDILAAATPIRFSTWDVKKRRRLFTMRYADARQFRSCSFSEDGSRIVLAYDDFTSEVRNARTGSVVRSFSEQTGAIVDQSLGADNREVLTASNDHTARVWDVATGLQTFGFDSQGGSFFRARFIPHTSEILAVFQDGRIQILPREVLLADVRRGIDRCLTPRQRRAYGLSAAPPRWCVTGIGRQDDGDPRHWVGLWPYRTSPWRDWLVLERSGRPSRMPASEDEEHEPVKDAE